MLDAAALRCLECLRAQEREHVVKQTLSCTGVVFEDGLAPGMLWVVEARGMAELRRVTSRAETGWNYEIIAVAQARYAPQLRSWRDSWIRRGLAPAPPERLRAETEWWTHGGSNA